MSSEDLKSQAERLTDHLAQVHGVRLKHASVLETLAAVHGVRNWQTLRAQATKQLGLLRRALSSFSGPPHLNTVCSPRDYVFESDARRLTYGVTRDLTKCVTVENESVRRHTLVVGREGYGPRSLLEDLCAQQVARGGGLVVLDTVDDPRFPRLLYHVASVAGRKDFHAHLPDAVVRNCHRDHAKLLQDPKASAELKHLRPLESSPTPADLAARGAEVHYISLPVVVPEDSNRAAARALLFRLLVDCQATREFGGTSDQPPLLVVVTNAHQLVQSDWDTLLLHMRPRHVSLVLQVPSLQAVPEAMLRECLLSITDTKVFFKPTSPEALEQAVQCIQAMAGPKPNEWVEQRSSGETVPPEPERLAQLHFGEALLAGIGRLTHIRTRMASLTSL